LSTADPDDITPEAAARAVQLLEGRRSAADQAMWQAPTLTFAAQAFLLAVLTNRSVPAGARVVALAAGVAACLTAIFALFRLRAREVQHSNAIRFYCETAGIPDPRPLTLPSRPLPAHDLTW
jgi:hypothetical protein